MAESAHTNRQALGVAVVEESGNQAFALEDHTAERAELHFLAAMVDELMKALLSHGVMTRAQLQEIEDAVSARTGTAPRLW